MKKTIIQHKFISVIRVLFSVLLIFIYFQTAHGQNYDYLESVTATGDGITTNNSKDWTDLTSVSIDLGSNSNDTKYVLVTASINMQPDGSSTQGREANYNIYRSDLTTDESGVIKRQIIRNSEDGVESWGIGTLVHIFDVSSLTGSKTYWLEHSNQGTSNNGRNVYSTTRLTAVALSTETNHYELSNDVKRLGETGVTTTSIIYAEVIGLTTDAISLPIKGDIYVSASINGKAGGAGSVAEYKLEYSTDGGSSWADLGKPVKRSMVNSYDDGIVSLVCMLQDQDADNDFKFRVSHRRVSGTNTITTHNCNLVAVALAHDGGGYFPSFCSEVGSTGVDITGISAPAATVTSSTFTAAADIGVKGTSLFVNAQYLVSASGLDESVNPDQRMRAGNQIYVSGASSGSAEEYYRYISDNDNFGAGGFIGLMQDLEDGGSYTIGMKHEVAYVSNPDGTEDETLTTSEVILTGFQTYDRAGYLWDGSASTVWTTADNWAYGVVPSTSAHDVTIPNVTNDPIITGTGLCECASLDIESDATFEISFESKLTVSDVLNNSGTIIIKSTSSGTGSLIVEGTATGDVTVERFLTQDRWHYIAGQTNISGDFGTSLGLTGGSDNDQFYRWEESLVNVTTGFWVDILNGNGSGSLLDSEGFVACKGYAINYITTDKTLSLSGVPYVANQSIDITKTDGSTNEGANLVGNPFCSTIAANLAADANSFLNTNNSILKDDNSAIYLWDEDADYTGNRDDYETISNSDVAKYIAVGQAFMVVKKDIGTTPLLFNTNIREHGSATFYKDAKQDEVPRFYMSVENREGLYNEILIAFIEGMTKGLDPSYDAGKLKGNPNIALYTKLIEDNGADFAHQALPPLADEVIEVKTGLDVSTAGNYTFKIKELQNFDETISIKLEDKLTGSLIDFRQDEEYSFFINTPGEIRERFVLHFNGVTGIEDDEHITKATIQTYGFNNTLYILNPEMKQGTVAVYNLTGQKVATFQLSGDTKQQQTLNVVDVINVVRIQTADEMISNKVIFK